jgi:antirestriction protein ArdC
MNLPDKIKHHSSQIDSISETILDQMKEGRSTWEMPWHNGMPEAWNPVTGKFYGGNNFLILWNECVKNNYSTNHWATFKQWQRKRSGVKVKKGEKGTLVMFAIPKKAFINENNPEGNQHNFEFISDEEKEEAKKNFYFRYYWVFNAAQVQGYDIDQQNLFSEPISELDRLKKFIKETNAEIKVGGNRAFYSVVEDFIQMPELARFKTVAGKPSQTLNYYSTLLHEIIHWTGHESRCGRQFGWTFGDDAYAFEELVAELGNGILTTQFNTQPIPRDDHAIYLNSWIKVLEDDFSYFNEALELARTAIYWLYKETEILPFDLKPQYCRTLSKGRVKKWENLV